MVKYYYRRTINDQSKDVHSSEWKRKIPKSNDMVKIQSYLIRNYKYVDLYKMIKVKVKEDLTNKKFHRLTVIERSDDIERVGNKYATKRKCR